MMLNSARWILVAAMLLSTTADAAPPTGADLFGQKTMQLFDAMKRRDAAALDGMLASDFIFTIFTGDVGNKQGYIDATVKAMTIDSFKLHPIAVHIYGDSAVVVYRLSLKAQVNGAPWSPELTSTDTWIQQAGVWKLASRHSSAVGGAR
jgi:ketosteroid isomerase-like protein